MKRSIRIVCYAVNGAGAGHLSRLVGIARWLRRYAAWMGARAEIYFLTSSEADTILFGERFASFKVPSKTVVADARIDKTTYIALAKQWVWHSMGLLRPDLLVVDTFPRGSFGELLSVLDLCRAKALVLRPMLEGFAQRPEVMTMLPLYDAILVPEREGEAVVHVPEEARAKVKWLGPMCSRERVEMMARREAREALSIPGDARCVYVSAGGGGDPGAPEQIARAAGAVAKAGGHAVIGAGPLYRGPVTRGPGVTWLAHEAAAELMHAFDAAVSAAGYNSFVELMHAGVPTVFVPQTKIADDQRARARRAEEAGAAIVGADDATADDLSAALTRLLSPEANARAREAARALAPRNHARDAASELLRLVAPHADVDRAEAAVGDALLESARAVGSVEAVIDLAHALEGGSGQTTRHRELAALGEAAALVARAAHDAAAPAEAALKLTQAVERRTPNATPEDRARTTCDLISRFAPFEDWDGAAALVTACAPGAGPDFTREITRAIDDAGARGMSLIEALAATSRSGA